MSKWRVTIENDAIQKVYQALSPKIKSEITKAA